VVAAALHGDQVEAALVVVEQVVAHLKATTFPCTRLRNYIHVHVELQ
jgi:hypothetical protein